MENSTVCLLCKEPSVKFRCKVHKAYLCSSHIQAHIESHDFCETENLSRVKNFPNPLQTELLRRLNLISTMRRSILQTTSELIGRIEGQSRLALSKLDGYWQRYRDMILKDPESFESEEVEKVLGSVLVKLLKTGPALELNGYYTGDFCVEKPMSLVSSDLIGTLEYLKTTWDLDIQGHTSSVLSLVYDKHRTLYSGSLDQTIKVWDWPGKNLKRTLSGHESGVTCLDLNKPNDKLVSGSSDNTIRVWSLLTFEALKVLRQHDNVVLGLCFTSDGSLLVSCSADRKIILWEFGEMEEFRIVSEHQNWVFSVAASPDGQYLASGSRDNSINVWRLKDLSLAFTMTEHKNDVVSLLFSFDSNFLFSGSTDRTIKVWATKDFSLFRTLTEHRKPLKSLAVSMNSLYSTSLDGVLVVWDLKTLEPKSKLDLKKKKINCLALAKHQEALVAVGFDDEVKLLTLSSPTEEGGSGNRIELNGHFTKIKEVLIYNHYTLAASYASDGLKLWTIFEKSLTKTCKTFADVIQEVNTHKELEKFLTYFS